MAAAQPQRDPFESVDHNVYLKTMELLLGSIKDEAAKQAVLTAREEYLRGQGVRAACMHGTRAAP